MGKIEILDFKKNNLRKINSSLQNINHKNNKRDFVIKNPAGEHAICAGLKEEMSVTIKGHVGYYCGGMNQKANIYIEGNAGTGLGENMMSGTSRQRKRISICRSYWSWRNNYHRWRCKFKMWYFYEGC